MYSIIQCKGKATKYKLCILGVSKERKQEDEKGPIFIKRR